LWPAEGWFGVNDPFAVVSLAEHTFKTPAGCQLFASLAYRHSAWQVFADFAEAAAITLSNAVDLLQRDRAKSATCRSSSGISPTS
jgi:hypothetical protein